MWRLSTGKGKAFPLTVNALYQILELVNLLLYAQLGKM